MRPATSCKSLQSMTLSHPLVGDFSVCLKFFGHIILCWATVLFSDIIFFKSQVLASFLWRFVFGFETTRFLINGFEIFRDSCSSYFFVIFVSFLHFSFIVLENFPFAFRFAGAICFYKGDAVDRGETVILELCECGSRRDGRCQLYYWYFCAIPWPIPPPFCAAYHLFHVFWSIKADEIKPSSSIIHDSFVSQVPSVLRFIFVSGGKETHIIFIHGKEFSLLPWAFVRFFLVLDLLNERSI